MWAWHVWDTLWMPRKENPWTGGGICKPPDFKMVRNRANHSNSNSFFSLSCNFFFVMQQQEHWGLVLLLITSNNMRFLIKTLIIPSPLWFILIANVLPVCSTTRWISGCTFCSQSSMSSRSALATSWCWWPWPSTSGSSSLWSLGLELDTSSLAGCVTSSVETSVNQMNAVAKSAVIALDNDTSYFV